MSATAKVTADRASTYSNPPATDVKALLCVLLPMKSMAVRARVDQCLSLAAPTVVAVSFVYQT